MKLLQFQSGQNQNQIYDGIKLMNQFILWILCQIKSPFDGVSIVAGTLLILGRKNGGNSVIIEDRG